MRLSCLLFATLTYTDIPAHTHTHHSLHDGGGCSLHPTSSGAPWPFFDGSTVHAHMHMRIIYTKPRQSRFFPTLSGRQVRTNEIHHVTQGFRLILGNHTLLVPIFNRLKEARELHKMVQESIPPLLAFSFCSSRKLLDRNGTDPEFRLLLKKFLLTYYATSKLRAFLLFFPMDRSWVGNPGRWSFTIFSHKGISWESFANPRITLRLYPKDVGGV